jgi:hypothetical protein
VSQIVSFVCLVLMIAMLGSLSACYKYKLARPEHMVPESALFPSYSLDSPLRNAIAISKVGGGEKTELLSSLPKVGNNELHEALRLSLSEYGFLSASDVAAPFHLEVFLIELKQPYGGLTKIVTSVMRYKLIRSCDDQVVYDDIITASYTATLEDAFDGGYRMKLANEGSIRANIAAFLRYLHSFKL